VSKNDVKIKYPKNGSKDEKADSGGGVRRNARAGGEDPRRGMRSDQGQNLGKSSVQETRARQELEELEGVSSTPCPQQSWGGGSLRAFRRPNWRLGGLGAWIGRGKGRRRRKRSKERHFLILEGAIGKDCGSLWA